MKEKEERNKIQVPPPPRGNSSLIEGYFCRIPK